MARILHQSHDTNSPGAKPDGEALWLDRASLSQATHWEWKPEGLCRGETCMPLPPRPGNAMVAGDRLDIAAFWRYAGWPVVHDSASQIWVLGEGAMQRACALTSLQAPDFELPDLDGHLHRLSDYRGRRVFLATWASW